MIWWLEQLELVMKPGSLRNVTHRRSCLKASKMCHDTARISWASIKKCYERFSQCHCQPKIPLPCSISAPITLFHPPHQCSVFPTFYAVMSGHPWNILEQWVTQMSRLHRICTRVVRTRSWSQDAFSHFLSLDFWMPRRSQKDFDIKVKKSWCLPSGCCFSAQLLDIQEPQRQLENAWKTTPAGKNDGPGSFSMDFMGFQFQHLVGQHDGTQSTNQIPWAKIDPLSIRIYTLKWFFKGGWYIYIYIWYDIAIRKDKLYLFTYLF